MQEILGRLSYANVMATVAVFLALGGGAYAALKLPKNSVGAKQIKKGAVTPAKLAAGTRKVLTGPAGPAGPVGAQGPIGQRGPAGQAGGVLPSGVTLRGSVAVGAQWAPATSKSLTTAVGFDGYRLSQRPVPHVIHEGDAPKIPATSACPGSAANPEAAPGHLCVYLASITPNLSIRLFVGDPGSSTGNGVEYVQSGQTATESMGGDGRVSNVGFILNLSAEVTSEGTARGTWAVTAP